jgi:hypothetical protein
VAIKPGQTCALARLYAFANIYAAESKYLVCNLPCSGGKPMGWLECAVASVQAIAPQLTRVSSVVMLADVALPTRPKYSVKFVTRAPPPGDRVWSRLRVTVVF